MLTGPALWPESVEAEEIGARLHELRAAAARLAGMRAIAAVQGVPLHRVAVESARDALERSRKARGLRPLSAGAWLRLSVELRAHLLTIATDTADPMRRAQGSWNDLSADERIAVGAAAREWRRQLEDAHWLR